MRPIFGFAAAFLLALPLGAQQPAEPIFPPPHVQPFPILGGGQNDRQIRASLAIGPELQRGESPRDMLAERRKLDAALAALQPQRRGTVDAYVVSVALDSAGHVVIAGFTQSTDLAGTAGGAQPANAGAFDAFAAKFSADLKELQDTVLSSHILSAELARDTVTSTICQLGTVVTDSGPVDVSEACAVLAAWDLSGNLDAKGAHLWREFWRQARVNPVSSLLPNPLLWTTPFSASDAVNTPSGLNFANPQVQRALGLAVNKVQGAGFALDAPLRFPGRLARAVQPVFGI